MVRETEVNSMHRRTNVTLWTALTALIAIKSMTQTGIHTGKQHAKQDRTVEAVIIPVSREEPVDCDRIRGDQELM